MGIFGFVKSNSTSNFSSGSDSPIIFSCVFRRLTPWEKVESTTIHREIIVNKWGGLFPFYDVPDRVFYPINQNVCHKGDVEIPNRRIVTAGQ